MKKKVYIFNGTSRAAVYGIGTYIEQLIVCLKKAGIEFDIIHLYAEGERVTITKKDGYNLINIPAVQFQSQIKAKLYYAKSVAYLLKEIIPEEKDIQLIFHLNFMTNEPLIIYLKRLFKCKIILVAHYTNWSFELFGNEEQFCALMKKKYATLKNDTEKKIYKDTKEDFRMLKKCDHFVCIANHTFRSFNKITDLTNIQTSIISNGIKDTYRKSEKERANLRKKYFLVPETPVILFAGRLDQVKGVSYLIKAFKKTQIQYPDARLFIAGEGDFLQLLNDSRGHWANISFTGRLSKKQLFEFYKIADIGVVCSLHEEFGLVAIEMMMHELPLIVSDTGGLSEIVEDRISGLKTPIQTKQGKRSINTSLLSQKINFLLAHPEKAKELGINARKRFLEKYELSVFQEKMVYLYQNL